MPRNASRPVIVALPAEIDLTNSASATAGLLDAASTAAIVIADMTATTFCDSSGTHSLITARSHAAALGSALRFAITPEGSVARMLALLGVDRMLAIYPTVQDATSARDDLPPAAIG